MIDWVYLTTDSGERKATGSYYTPEYVVEYIVENTLEPLVDGIREDLVGNVSYDDETETGFAEEFADRIFELKILDPAMGSGHFLTNTIDYLAREIIDAQERQAEQQGVETVGEGQDINWARRQVAQHCIYGVDLNPLAVELAKVSLWLRTLAAEQPLAFLDHHLKTGNSLVGSDIESIDELETDANGGPNASLADFGAVRRGTIDHLMDVYEEFIAIENTELADAKEMERKYREIERDDLRNRLVAMANVKTAENFDLDLPNGAYERMARALDSDEQWAETGKKDWFQSAQVMAAERNFLHWKLEFPEVFYEVDGTDRENPGFDAVIGNPPYIRSIHLKDADRTGWKYYRQMYETAKEREYDIYLCFAEKGINLLNGSGEFGYILPNKWFTSKVGQSIRQFLTDNRYLNRIVDFQSFQVFGNVTTYTCLLFLNRENNEQYTVSQLTDAVGNRSPLPANSGDWLHGEQKTDNFDGNPWSFSISPAGKLFEKLDDSSKLGDTARIFQGVGTRADPVFLLENDDQGVYSEELEEYVDIENGLLHPALKGNDIDSYHYQDGRMLLFPYEKGNRETSLIDARTLKQQYPKTWQYLERVRDTLEARESGKYEDRDDWYAFGRPQNMERLGEKKAVVPDVVKEAETAHDERGEYIVDTVYGVVSDEFDSQYLTALLNNDLLTAFLQLTGTDLRGGYFRMKTAYLNPFPIPEITFDTPDTERAEVVENVMADYDNYLQSSPNTLLTDVEQCVNNGKEDIVHDLLAKLTENITTLKNSYRALNLSLPDYLGTYDDGSPLGDLYQPPAGLADSILTDTAAERANLRLGTVTVVEEGSKLVVRTTARYKPNNPDEHETDRWDYTETEPEPAMEFVGLSEAERALIRAFVPHAAEEAGGYAGFRETATKTNSLVDRLEALTLPELTDIEDGLERYRQREERAEELEEKIEKTDELIDQIVYQLYGLTDEEIEIVEEAVGDD